MTPVTFFVPLLPISDPPWKNGRQEKWVHVSLLVIFVACCSVSAEDAMGADLELH